jgi:CRP-like cAMP-binding protein
MDVKELRRIELFSRLSNGELKRLAQWTDEVTVDEGYALAKEGEFAHEFFVIEEGTAEVIQDGNRLIELAPGAFFGEIGLLETERRTASVIATSPMRLIVMFQSQFRQMEHEMPTVADRIRVAIRARLENSPSS